MNDTICGVACEQPERPKTIEPKSEKEEAEELSRLAKAISHPARIQIIGILARKRQCVCGDIVSEMPLAQSTVSEHLRILKSAGLIIGTIDGPRVCYCLDAFGLDRLKSLVAKLPLPERSFESSECQEA
jgi:ArsR family transcriptional regulator